MYEESLGKAYNDGETIIQKGDVGKCMYIIQEGHVEVLSGHDKVRLAVLGEGDFIGEMSLFDRDVRSATVRSLGEARVLTVDREVFLSHFKYDTTLAFRIVGTMSRRIRNLDDEIVLLKEEMGRIKEIVNKL